MHSQKNLKKITILVSVTVNYAVNILSFVNGPTVKWILATDRASDFTASSAQWQKNPEFIYVTGFAQVQKHGFLK